ncbi:unnamed protein product [Ceratitis capitata]|uniref:(Mediterranean fruit fly) hypothetical protein n=1 Tax=Ceratitis capitata TaxID=7213 RepID=A0A811VD88_CERCA|nr:unnamed protein product [Ceratitis capitata]
MDSIQYRCIEPKDDTAYLLTAFCVVMENNLETEQCSGAKNNVDALTSEEEGNLVRLNVHM